MKPINLLGRAMLVLGVAIASVSCTAPSQPAPERNSTLTQGQVQMNLQVGETRKAEVLEAFGAPNITTRDGDGMEVWTYQRSARVSQSTSRSGLWSILLAPNARGAGGLLGASSSSGFETTSRMITLIIEFDAADVVSDFRSRTADF